GRAGYSLPPLDVPESEIGVLIPPPLQRRELPGLPEVSEIEVVRHFLRLSQWNYALPFGLYPLGSCTMKYNPRVNEMLARLPQFTKAHPLQPEDLSQGALRLMYELEHLLAEISGLDRVSLHPAAGAHGELAGMMMIRAYHQAQGNPRKIVLIPDSAHGTNPSSCVLSGYQAKAIPSDERGLIDPAQVSQWMSEEVAAIMITNPNTLGLFEEEIGRICQIVHSKGGLVYGDGANLNAVLGIVRPGDIGFDVLHLNLHKTFSTPHGGGGPGAGPVAVRKILAPFLPVPVVEKEGERFRLNYDLPRSIGKVRAFHSNFAVLVRAYAYILSMGAAGLKRVAEMATLNANYLRTQLASHYHIPFDRLCKHEFVASDKNQQRFGIKTLDIAKRLMDKGFHPPTIYFPLIVPGALMIEPTESESKEGLDEFIAAMREIAEEAEQDPTLLTSAPHLTKVSRLDEVKAARELDLRWKAK
ncbi:MAG: aminomethyl-transferring glycine dehydrogenase subunit GcvPB, partial [candidate division NC10 bacterium]|nr:aminomethyl-transferring glycine dehydrogenase subunit GcvPB [candidate division NC10 bacterium]